ncbi:MAG: RsmB/NOP family class I SAM-dependent RNA methyltransferase [Candidatus Bathyarchaeota archaeon]|nr:MAG: RsmB/NOP family class I SAM-dependent RNA methyltransferase [Candidatus Bathyarchaeota archaeon]
MSKAAWTLAIEALSWIELKRIGERTALSKVALQLGINDSKAVRLAHKLVFETIRRKNLIDSLVNSVVAPGSLNDFRLGLRAFLRLYTYETKVARGSFEKAVRIARMGRSILGWRELQKVEETLGEIRNINVDDVLKRVHNEEKVGLLTFHPTWFVKYCFLLLGRMEALKYLESSIEAPSIYVRINTLKAPERVLLSKIGKEGVTLEKVPGLRYTYRVIRTEQLLTRTQSFQDGFFYIQDKASCLAAEVAHPQRGMTVLDVCAAPAAKTTYLAQRMENKGTICSLDYSRRRMNVWKRETERMGVKIAVPVLADVRKPLPLKTLADLVILDPPCTSTGAFNRMPSAKWRLGKRSLRSMSRIQWEMLNVCGNYVDNGGYLVYSTCSIAVEENEMLIERFLKWHPQFTLVETLPRIGRPGLRGQTTCQRLYPHLHDCNGFFIAKLLKEPFQRDLDVSCRN